MGNQIKIEGDEAHSLAIQLASLRGGSLTSAVAHASRHAVEREQQGLDQEAEVAAIKKIAAEIRQHVEHPLPGSDHSWLYDEDGLPA